MVYQNCGSMYGVKKNQLKEDLNQALRNRDKMKDGAIAHLSDQVMALTAKMHEIERRQQPYQQKHCICSKPTQKNYSLASMYLYQKCNYDRLYHYTLLLFSFINVISIQFYLQMLYS